MEGEGEQLIELHITVDDHEYTLVVSHENAQRAVNDSAYRASLLSAALDADRLAQQQVHEHAGDRSSPAGAEDIANTGRWTDEAQQLLISEYAERKVLFEEPKRHKALWKAVTEELNARGYSYSTKQVISKMDTLKRRYRATRDSNAKSGNGRTVWVLFSAMDDIFGERKTCNLGDMIDSDCPPADSPPPSSPSSASEASTPTASSKKRRSAHEVYLEGLFARMTELRAAEEARKQSEREEREKAREARHTDKQELGRAC